MSVLKKTFLIPLLRECHELKCKLIIKQLNYVFKQCCLSTYWKLPARKANDFCLFYISSNWVCFQTESDCMAWIHQYFWKCYLTVLLNLNKSSMLLSTWLKKDIHCVRGKEYFCFIIFLMHLKNTCLLQHWCRLFLQWLKDLFSKQLLALFNNCNFYVGVARVKHVAPLNQWVWRWASAMTRTLSLILHGVLSYSK